MSEVFNGTFSGKPILCLDFDGVLHSYVSGWQGADVVADPPVDGAMLFLIGALAHFDVQIYSSRSKESAGIVAMRNWINDNLMREFGYETAERVRQHLQYPTQKPAAFLTIDDRAIAFNGTWPKIEDLKNFKPWNKRDDFAQRVLDTHLDDNDAEADTVRDYLKTLLHTLWNEEEGFSGKRPFGNSGWTHDLIAPLVKAGLVDGRLDDEGYVETYSNDSADQALSSAIEALR